MSELVDFRANGAFIRSQLLATASVFALTAYIASTGIAKSEEADRPLVWIELGGQMEQVQGTTSPFIAPFMTAITPTPDVYGNDIFVDKQRPAKLALGGEGHISFQPLGSDWMFSAGLRFGRSQTNRHSHHQQGEFITHISTYGYSRKFPAVPFADAKGSNNESHAILDFSVGKDVGFGAFGRTGTSFISAGVRFADFSTKSTINAMGRPKVTLFPSAGYFGEITFYNYTMIAHAERSFRGIGPSLSWNASATVLGSEDEGELTFDWAINGAVLFGRQKAAVTHTTQAYHLPTAFYHPANYYARIYQNVHQTNRVRSVAVPNLGGLVGFSVKYPNAKVSLGYRADFFFGAADAGIDQRRTKNLGFSGPFATIGIGFGG